MPVDALDGSLAAISANVTHEQAAPSTEGSQYALSLIRAAKIQSGQDGLVHGATGAIGSAAVQLLKSLGASVTAVCDTKNVELVEGLGPDRVIDYMARTSRGTRRHTTWSSMRSARARSADASDC
jgi:NADPH:quinone reductase-like Zn-dependent oxidoreductase